MQNKRYTFIRWLFFLGLCFIALFLVTKYLKQPVAISAPKQSIINGSETLTKKEHWQAMEQKVASWGDALGLGIDPGIKKMVIVLNLLNVKTIQSCEGHLKWGRPYPWVMISTKTPELGELQERLEKNLQLIQEKEAEIQKKHPDLPLGEAFQKEDTPELNELYKERHSLVDKIRKSSRLKMLPLNNLIHQFYKKHPIDPDKMVALSEMNLDTFEVFSLGGPWQMVRGDEKSKKLEEYQHEMNAFADFLTDYYFSAYP